MADRNSGPEERRDANPANSTRSLRGMRGSGSLRGGLGRGSAAPSNASMVPSRSSYASASGSSAPGAKLQFRPVIPQRRKPSESPAPQPVPDPSQAASSNTLSGGTSRGGGSGRGRGGARPPRQSAQMTASGPFALGPSSRPSSSRARVTPLGPGGSGLVPAASSAGNGTDPSSSKADPDRGSYRNPDKLKDTEEYSDPEDGSVAIIDMDQVFCLDDLAPIALPRVAEKTSKKDRLKAASERQRRMAGRVKTEDDKIQVKPETDANGEPMDESSELDTKRATTVSSGTVTPQPGTEADDIKINAADALDLSESEGEELMDDLVDDFVFNQDEDTHQVTPDKRLYLFQFPQLFPKFKAGPLDDSATSKRRTVSFAEGTAGGAGSPRPVEIKDESSEEDDDVQRSDGGVATEDDLKESVKRGPHKLEGQIGKLNVYRDGRVFFRFGELIMEVTGGSQSTFLQQVMLLNKKGGTATALGELHRKFIVTPELDCMLNDISIHDEEQRLLAQTVKREKDERDIAENRSKFGHVSAGTNFTTL